MPSRNTPPAPGGALTFFREFLRAPALVGSIIPSSRALVNRMLDQVDYSACRLFVEYGPGLGTFTRDALARLAPDAYLIAIDLNPRFIDHLARTIDDPRLIPVQGSAADVRGIIADHGFTQADYVLSGLPFSTLPKGVGDQIVAATRDALRPGGQFLIYQYSAFVTRLLRPHFSRIEPGTVWRNIPPCQYFVAYKESEALSTSR